MHSIVAISRLCCMRLLHLHGEVKHGSFILALRGAEDHTSTFLNDTLANDESNAYSVSVKVLVSLDFAKHIENLTHLPLHDINARVNYLNFKELSFLIIACANFDQSIICKLHCILD